MTKRTRTAADVLLNMGGGLQLPLGTISDTAAILGIRGSGKTNTAAVYVEELLKNGQQVVIFDPTDAWWGLKSSKDGKSAGYPVVVLGGRHGDAPLDDESGTTIADFIIDKHASVVLSMRHFENHSAERRVVHDVCRRLYFRKGQTDNPTPLLVVIDEAHLFAPQRVMSEDAHTLGAVQQLVRQGRASGFGVILIDQRAASVNKDVLTQVETLIVHRTKGPQDRKALQAWTEQHDTGDNAGLFLDTLASLRRGEAWIWSPGWLQLFTKAQIRERETFDSSFTPSPGETRVTPTTLAPVDLEALRAALGETIEKAKADDPDLLRARIAELEAAAETLYDEHPDDAARHASELEAAERDAYARGYAEGNVAARGELLDKVGTMLGWAQQADREQHDAAQTTTRVREELDELRALLDAKPNPSAAKAMSIISVPARAPARKVKSTVPAVLDGPSFKRDQPKMTHTITTANATTPLAQQILDALTFFLQLNVEQATRAQIAAYIGYHPRTPAFVAALDGLVAQQLIEMDRGFVALTLAGRRRGKLVDVDVVQSLAQLHRVWLRKLDGIENRIVYELTKGGRRESSREAIAKALDYHPRTPAFVKALKKLKALDMIALARGNVAPSATLYPAGLR